MKLNVDEQNDALHFRLNESAIVESEEVAPGVILDYDAQGRVVGIELLNVKERAQGQSLRELHFQSS